MRHDFIGAQALIFPGTHFPAGQLGDRVGEMESKVADASSKVSALEITVSDHSTGQHGGLVLLGKLLALVRDVRRQVFINWSSWLGDELVGLPARLPRYERHGDSALESLELDTALTERITVY